MKYNYNSNLTDYLTPPELIKQGLELCGDSKFDLDTCCSDLNIPARSYFFKGYADGLTENWAQLNWCNPPYNECEKWVKKAYEEQQKGNTTVMLIPVRTETAYWHKYILFNDNCQIKWLRKGYAFINAKTKEKCGIFKNALALVYFKNGGSRESKLKE